MPIFYTHDPSTQGDWPFGPKFETMQAAIDYARKLQWRTKSYGVNVLAVVAEVSPVISETEVTVTSEFTKLLPASQKEK